MNQIQQLWRDLIKQRQFVATALAVAGVGIVGLLLTGPLRAATFSAVLELEDGALSGNTASVSDTQASGGSAVAFGNTTPVADAIIISPSGDDTSGNGTATAPYKTFAKALSGASAGSTIYARAGTYAEKFTISKSGSAGEPITIATYPGEKAKVVGGQAEYYGQGIIYAKGIHDVTIQGLEVSNITGDGEGIFIQDSNNVAIKNNLVHDIQHVGIDVSGSNITVDGNEVYNACLTNTNGSYGTGGWPPALTTKKLTTGTSSTNISITNNYVHDSWGEGIDAWFLNGGTIDGNRSVNNYSVDIYVDDSKDINVTNNYVASTNSTHDRSDNGAPPTGIAIASETGSTRPTNMVVNGNTLGGTLNAGIVNFLDNGKEIIQGPNPQNF